MIAFYALKKCTEHKLNAATEERQLFLFIYILGIKKLYTFCFCNINARLFSWAKTKEIIVK